MQKQLSTRKCEFLATKQKKKKRRQKTIKKGVQTKANDKCASIAMDIEMQLE